MMMTIEMSNNNNNTKFDIESLNWCQIKQNKERLRSAWMLFMKVFFLRIEKAVPSNFNFARRYRESQKHYGERKNICRPRTIPSKKFGSSR
jgi:hypothetical protein